MRCKFSLFLFLFGWVVELAPLSVNASETLTTIDYPGATLTVAMGINSQADIVSVFRSMGPLVFKTFPPLVAPCVSRVKGILT